MLLDQLSFKKGWGHYLAKPQQNSSIRHYSSFTKVLFLSQEFSHQQTQHAFMRYNISFIFMQYHRDNHQYLLYIRNFFWSRFDPYSLCVVSCEMVQCNEKLPRVWAMVEMTREILRLFRNVKPSDVAVSSFIFFNFVNCSFESALHWENNGSISADCNNCSSWGLFWLQAEGLQSQWNFIKCFDSC